MFVLSTDLFKIKDQMYFHIFPTQASVFLGLHTESMTAMKHSGLRRKNVLAERLKGAPDLSTVTSIPIWLLYVCHSLVLPNQSFCFGARLSCVFFFSSGDNFPGSFSITLSPPIWLPVLLSRTGLLTPSSFQRGLGVT